MTLVAILVLLLILVLAVPVAAGLGWLGLVLNQLYSPISLIVTTGEVTWSTTTSFILVAVPFYVLMGEIMLRTGMAERMYAAIAQWVSWLPGGLMHSNVVACAVWGAPSGSSVATAVTVGTVAIGEIKKHNYNEPLFLGTIAAGGTLGILIPPSINMVVYGAMTDTSIPKLYLAGFIPGFVLSILFMATVLIACLWRPAWGGTPVVTSWEARIRTLPGLLPPLVILAAVIGSIYIGWATATEAAALGILAAFAYAAYERSLSVKVIGEIFEGTARTTGMIMAIVIGAYFLNVVITTIGLPNQIGTLVKSLDLSPFGTLMLIIVFYLILGMFMETLSMMVATIPITTPIVVQAGYDPVWYGILVVLLMEAALLTPPVGMNLFVVQGIRERGDLNDVIVGTLPFIVTLFVMIGLIVAFPGHRDVAAELPELNDRQRRTNMGIDKILAAAAASRGAHARGAGAGPAEASLQGADPGQPDAAREAARGAALERMDTGGLRRADHRRCRALRSGRHSRRCRAAAAQARRLRLCELRHREGRGRRSEIRGLRSLRPDAHLRGLRARAARPGARPSTS